MKFRLLLATILLTGSFAASAQQTRILTAEKHNDYGIVYMLPTTVLDIELEAERTVYKTGPFKQYARKYIGTDKVVTEDGESWTLTRVRVTPRGVADADKRYVMQLKPGALTSVCVADDGMLLAINRDAEPTKILDAWKSSELSQSTLTDNEYLQYVDEDYIASQSSAKRAQLLAESLMEVRNSKVALSRGTAETMPTDGRQLELMLESLRHQEKCLTEAFTGTIQTQKAVTKLTYVPVADKTGRHILCRLSDFAGFVASDDYSGDPVYIDIREESRGQLPLNEKGEERAWPKDGVAYMIPGTAHITISTGGRGLFDADIELAQYGVTFALQPNLFSDKKAPQQALFNPTTGALISIEQAER